jgi:hypothetical protein
MRAAPHVSAPLASAGYRRGLEAVATREELAEALMKKTLLPGRRFRVEGSSFNNSGLVTRRQAQGLVVAHGGSVVEIITAEVFFLNHEGCEVDCPRCGSERGHPCTTLGSRGKTPCRIHLARIEALPRRNPCTTCQAEPHSPCIATRGKTARTPMKGLHRARKEAEAARPST